MIKRSIFMKVSTTCVVVIVVVLISYKTIRIFAFSVVTGRSPNTRPSVFVVAATINHVRTKFGSTGHRIRLLIAVAVGEFLVNRLYLVGESVRTAFEYLMCTGSGNFFPQDKRSLGTN